MALCVSVAVGMLGIATLGAAPAAYASTVPVAGCSAPNTIGLFWSATSETCSDTETCNYDQCPTSSAASAATGPNPGGPETSSSPVRSWCVMVRETSVRNASFLRSLFVLGVLAIVFAGLISAGADARTLSARARHAVQVVDLKFRKAGRAPDVESDGRYVFVVSGDLRARSGVLIDEKTRRRTRVRSPRCPATPQFGGRWLMFDCAPGRPLTAELYELGSGRWRRVTASPSIQAQCAGTTPGACGISGFGAQWIEYNVICANCVDPESVFQNIDTGVVRSAPADSPSRVVDLDSRSLLRDVCSPVRAPAGGSLTFYGTFVIAARRGASYLEHCGSRLHKPLTSLPSTGDSRALLWAYDHQLKGLFLPSLRAFAAPLPVAIPGYRATFVLSSRTLYALSVGGQLWSAARPQP